MSFIRFFSQLIFLLIIFYVAIVGVWKGLILVLIFGATIFLGRLFCGWVCPLGFYMDIMILIRKVFKESYWSLSQKFNRLLHRSRYLVALFIFGLALIIFLLNVNDSFSFPSFLWMRPPFSVYAFFLEPLQTPILPWKPPFGALFELFGIYWTFPYVGEIFLYLKDSDFVLVFSYVFVGLVLAFSFKVRRFWCRFCPTGVSFGVLNRFRLFSWLPLLRLNKTGEKCTKCGICQRVCPFQVTEIYDKKDGDIKTTMCALCLRCVEMCPENACLKLRFAGQTIWQSRNWLQSAQA